MVHRDKHLPTSGTAGEAAVPATYDAPGRREEQRAQSVPQFGRAPKGYRRSDARIREDICERLLYDPHIDSSEVSVEVHDGRVVLEGSVTERRMKHAIEDIAASCAGVADVDNRIKVLRPAWREAPPFLY
jgi:osmotically-inducible protein OsmY